MADGRWVMTKDELNKVVCGFDGGKSQDIRKLPNYGSHRAVDNRGGKAEVKCAFCGGTDLMTGLGGYGEGYGYRSSRCKACGGTTDFVYKDEVGKFLK